jgi:hypothetical protein
MVSFAVVSFSTKVLIMKAMDNLGPDVEEDILRLCRHLLASSTSSRGWQ